MNTIPGLGKISQVIPMNASEFDRLGKFINQQVGIKMPPSKRVFLQCRLQKRLRDLNLSSFSEYIEILFSPAGATEEMAQMFNAVSTHTTDFFREVHHFDFLAGQGLDAYCNSTGKSEISVWSAGCSTGEEPYSLAFTLSEFRNKRYIDYNILATDIAESVLEYAATGIYPLERIGTIPELVQKKYLLKGFGDFENKVRVSKDIREKITFRMFNLKGRDYGSLDKFDIIFCRNVLIYFERETQLLVLQQLCNKLAQGGYLFLGHSESVTGMDLPLIQIKPTVLQKADRTSY